MTSAPAQQLDFTPILLAVLAELSNILHFCSININEKLTRQVMIYIILVLFPFVGSPLTIEDRTNFITLLVYVTLNRN